MKIGIYGGTFDPVHLGHINIGINACNQYQLDEVWYMPALIPPHKQGLNISPDLHRINMLNLALERYSDKLKVCKYELEQSCISYSYKTVSVMKELHPNYSFYYIMGEDSLLSFDTWRHPEIIAKLTTILVAPRDNKLSIAIKENIVHYIKKYNCDIRLIKQDIINISSTEIKAAIACGKSILNLVPIDVANYIYTNNLYK